MDISLREITEENYEGICEIEVTDNQERHLSSNTRSLVDFMFRKTLIARGIFIANKSVGFLMWDRPGPETAGIWRFMVDKDYQQQGIGFKALEMAIEEIRQSNEVRRIEIFYSPDNLVAKKLYASVGFVEVGMDKEGIEMVARIEA